MRSFTNPTVKPYGTGDEHLRKPSMVAASSMPDHLSIFEDLRRAHFKVIETIARMLGVDKRGADNAHLYLNKVVDGDKVLDGDITDNGLAFTALQTASAMGNYAAIAERSKRDPEVVLNICRRIAAADSKLFDRFITKEVAEVFSDSRAGAFIEVAAAARSMISPLEDLVKQRLLTQQLLTLGAKLTERETQEANSVSWKISGENADGFLSIDFPNLSIRNAPKQFLLGVGSSMLRVSTINTLIQDFDMDAEQRTMAMVRTRITRDSKLSAEEGLRDDIGFSIVWALVFASHWALSGFPLIQPTHMLAASNMMTAIPAELVPEIAVPWDAFGVDIPHGLLEDDVSFVALSKMSNMDSIESAIKIENESLVAKEIVDHWVLLVHKGNGLSDRYLVHKLEYLANLSFDGPTQNIAPLAKDAAVDEREARLVEVLGRLVLSTLIEIDSDEHKDRVARGPGVDARADDRVIRGQKLPAQWTFVIRRPINVDVRSAVREYVATGARAVGVQTLVRGHKKRQPYGPRSSLRKWIHVEPHWRGPEDAPIALRPHRVGPKEE